MWLAGWAWQGCTNMFLRTIHHPGSGASTAATRTRDAIWCPVVLGCELNGCRPVSRILCKDVLLASVKAEHPDRDADQDEDHTCDSASQLPAAQLLVLLVEEKSREGTGAIERAVPVAHTRDWVVLSMCRSATGVWRAHGALHGRCVSLSTILNR